MKQNILKNQKNLLKIILCKPVIGEKIFLPSQKNYDIKESIHKKSKKILFIKNISYNIKNKNILNNINFKLFYGIVLEL